MKPLNMLSKIWKSFCNRDRPFSSSTWSGRLFFCSGGFCVCIRSKQGELVPTRNFLNLFFTNPTSKTLVGLRPNPIFSAKITLNEQIFLEKNVFRKLALIHSILHQTGTITSGFEGKKRKYHLLKIWVILWYALSRAVHKNRTSQVRFSPSKPDLIRPKNACMIVICFLQLLIEPWKLNDCLHGIPGHDPQVGEPENAAERGQEHHAERTALKIWNYVDTQNQNQ